MEKLKSILFALVLSFVLCISTATAVCPQDPSTPPALPMFFAGTLTIDAEPAPVGTEVVAKVNYHPLKRVAS